MKNPFSVQNLPYVLVPALLVIVALTQMTLALATPLTPWKGGGFGMFSSNDHSKMRFLSATAVDTRGYRLKIAVNQALRELDPRLAALSRTFPTHAGLRQAGELLLNQRYVFTDAESDSPHVVKIIRDNPGRDMREFHEQFGLPGFELDTLPESENAVELFEISLRLWQFRFDPDTHKVWSEPLSGTVTVRKRPQ